MPARSSVFSREVLAVAAEARVLRELALAWLTVRGFGTDRAEDARLVANEAMENVIQHAYPAGIDGTMSLTMTADEHTVTVVVADTGRGFADDSGIGDGHGLRLMFTLSPGTVITTGPVGTTVRLAWPWAPL